MLWRAWLDRNWRRRVALHRLLLLLSLLLGLLLCLLLSLSLLLRLLLLLIGLQLMARRPRAPRHTGAHTLWVLPTSSRRRRGRDRWRAWRDRRRRGHHLRLRPMMLLLLILLLLLLLLLEVVLSLRLHLCDLMLLGLCHRRLRAPGRARLALQRRAQLLLH